MVDPLQQPAIVYEIVAAVYGLSGLLLALYQMGSYRRPNTWLILLHRPLPHWQIAAALLGAGACMMLVAVVLPLLLMLAGQAGLTARVVDARHWLLPLAAWLIAACCYLAGCFAMLAPRRIAAAALVFPLLFTASQATGPSALLVQGAVLAWLLALVFFAFKPDLSRPPSRWSSASLVAVTVQMAVYLLLCTGALVYQLLWMLQGSHPLNSAPPAGGYIEASRADGADLIVAGLADSRMTSAPLWREQARLAEVFTWQRQFDALPVRNELGNIAPMEFDDEARRLRWIFSHDRMRLVGVNLVDGKPAGTLGLGAGKSTFPRPALPIGGRFLISTDTVYAYDTHELRVLPRIALPHGETFAVPPSAMGEVMFAASDRALYTFDARAFTDGDALLQPRQRIALPGRIGDLDRVDVIELIDGYLVSFVFGLGSTDGPGLPVQKILQLQGDGRATEVGPARAGAGLSDRAALLPVLAFAGDACAARWRDEGVVAAPCAEAARSAGDPCVHVVAGAAADAGLRAGERVVVAPPAPGAKLAHGLGHCLRDDRIASLAEPAPDPSRWRSLKWRCGG